MKWEYDGDVYRAPAAGKAADRWWTIKQGDSGAWHLRAPDNVRSVHATLALAKAEAREGNRLGIR